MKILSFIIPAYNAGQFLDKCISSMLCPDVLQKLDIVIVDDGSSDATAAIAQGYCSRYPHSIRLIRQENKGHGGALNTGCAAAAGKYLKIIDADDWVQTRSLPAFISALEECESDVVLTHHYTRDVSTGKVRKWKSYPPCFARPLTMEQIVAQPGDFFRSLTFHGITYRRDFYRQQGIALSEHIFYEDQEYSTIPCCHARSITCLDLFVYNYRIGDMAQSMSDANQLKRLHHMQAVLARLLDAYGTQDLTDAGKVFFQMKLKIFVLGYLLVLLLAETDKAVGREKAQAVMALLKDRVPEAYAMSVRQYKVFCLMNRLHIPKSLWDRLMDSRLYHRLKGNHSLD